MSQLAQRLPSAARALRSSPLRIVTALAVAMSAVAVYVTSLRLERVLFAFNLDTDQVFSGLVLPAIAFDGSSTGTLTFSDENGYLFPDGSVDAATTIGSTLQSIVLPYYVAELINAVVVLGLCAVLLLLCIGLLRGGPFVRLTTVSLALFAVLLAVGSIAGQLVRRLPFASEGYTAAFREQGILTILETKYAQFGGYQPGIAGYEPGGEPGLDLFPLGVAILIALVTAAFWLGHRMQRDTQGLV